MGGTTMQWQERLQRARAEWMLLTFYERFEQIIILILTGLIAIVIVFAVWNLTLKIFHGVIAPQTFDPSEYSVFQAVFGAIFTVIIALEFKRSLLVVAQRQESIVQVRTVVLIALLAIVRKVMILDLASTEALQLFALAAAILATGVIPPKATTDATHIALAASHGIEYLLTWNCKHIANAQIIRRIETICRRQGYQIPVICTPGELMGEEGNDAL
jgi:uncharacterized membrane protein (DUF373 family)